MHRNAANKRGKKFLPSNIPKVHKRINDNIECLYLCMSCDERFNLAQELLIHTRSHSDNLKAKQSPVCCVCSKGFTKQQTLKKHMRVHLSRGVYECSKCDEQFSSTRLVRRHELACTRRTRSKKKKGPKRSSSRNGRCLTKNMKEIKRRDTGSTSRAGPVKNIPHETRQVKVLLKLRDSRKVRNRRALAFYNSQKLSNISTFIYQTKEFTRAFDPFYKHPEDVKVKKSSRSVKPNGVTVEEVETQQPIITHPYACAGCEEHFMTIPLLRKHYKEVHMKVAEVVTYPCKKCNKVCASNEELKQHDRTHSLDDGAHECVECVKRFVTLRDLHIHMHIHTTDRRFLCTVCNKRFTQLANLNAHKVIHSDDRPFACAQCDLKFKRPDSLQRHERLHTNERPYKCTECDKEFTRPANLRTHLLSHAEAGNLLCKKCNKCFEKQGDLEQHMLEHSRELCFICVKCNKSFSCEYDLKLHESEHDGGEDRLNEQEVFFNPDNDVE